MRLPPLGLAVVCFLSAGASLRAQLIHCSASGVINSHFLADGWFPGPDGGVGQEFQFDLFYDSSLRPDRVEGVAATYPAANPKQNFWRLRMGAVDVAAPFSALTVWETGGFAINYYDELCGELTVDLEFAGPWFVDTLPRTGLPPFLFGFLYFNRWSVDGIGAGLVMGDALQVVSRELPPMTPIPEPSAYGAASILALLGVAGWRWRNRSRSIRAS